MTDHELQLKAVALRRALAGGHSKPIEFDGFGNCGEFAIIKTATASPKRVLIPSNSTELELATGVVPRH